MQVNNSVYPNEAQLRGFTEPGPEKRADGDIDSGLGLIIIEYPQKDMIQSISIRFVEGIDFNVLNSPAVIQRQKLCLQHGSTGRSGKRHHFASHLDIFSYSLWIAAATLEDVDQF